MAATRIAGATTYRRRTAVTMATRRQAALLPADVATARVAHDVGSAAQSAASVVFVGRRSQSLLGALDDLTGCGRATAAAAAATAASHVVLLAAR